MMSAEDDEHDKPFSRTPRVKTGLACAAVLLAVFGFMLFVTSVYAASKFSSRSWAAYVMGNAAWVGIVASLLSCFSSLSVCVAMRRQSPRVLFCTALACTLLLAFQIAGTVTMSNFANQLNVGDPSLPAGSYTSFSDVAINNAVFSIYVKCCSGCPSGCNNTQPGAYDNFTLPFCAPPHNQCQTVQACQDVMDSNCFVIPQRWHHPRIPPVTVAQEVCEDLEYLSLNGRKLVGPASLGSCGGGSPAIFLDNLADYVRSSVGGVVAVNTFIALIIGFMALSACYLASRRVWLLRQGGAVGGSRSSAGHPDPGFMELPRV